MNHETLKKMNPLYFLSYILIPAAVTAVCFWLGYTFFHDGGAGAAILFMGPSFLSILWWAFGGKLLFKAKRKKLIREFQNSGFRPDQTFDSDFCTVLVDMEQGRLGLIFFWNPFKNYILPAARITKIWTDDGKTGAGVLAGSSRVSFLFLIDGIRIRVNTFTSNKRWRMDTEYILTGISKADLMADVLTKAKERSV
ncbi:MAG: hypothetical protein HFI81_00875 [Eubacterium sp.]|jgi:hypothetical protein|nr:hypothetical protein [Eubacterium sp.]